MSALQRAIDVAGGITALAGSIGVSPQVIVHWRKRGLPVERVKAVVRAIDNQVTAHELAPDVFPDGFEFPPEEQAAA